MLAACGSSDKKNSGPVAGEIADSGINTGTATEITGTIVADNAITSDIKTNDTIEPVKTGEATNHGDANEQLLQSASIDLDDDGESELVEAVQLSSDSAESGSAGELTGQLIIRDGSSDSKITFWEKNAGMAGLLTSMQFKDLDGDGSNDVFIIIPGNGASFSYSNYFIYSYKKKISYSFTSDSNLADFIDEFHFKYAGDNKLSIINSKRSFTADLAIEFENDQEPSDEYMSEYEQLAWINPVPVDISEGSRLALTTGANGMPEIKIPLPVFGLATVDMIGELDLYYSVDSSFNPVLKRFEVLDFKGADKTIAGSCGVK